jgi:hypothetical protein
MAQTKNYQVAVMQETTPNTYEAPAAGGDFIEMAEVPTLVNDQETIERSVVRGSLGRLKSRRGQKIGTSELIVELKSSGNVTASQADVARIEQLIEACLGAKNRQTSNDTVSIGGGSTDTIIETDASDYNVGDVVMIANEVRHVKSIGTGPDSITLNQALANGAPADSTVIYRGSTMKPDSADARRYSLTAYDQPSGTAGWETQIIGAAVANMNFQDISNGALPKAAFNFDGVDWEVAANITNAIAPVFEAGTPPDNLNVYMNINGVVVDSNNLTLTVDKSVTPQKVITNASGILSRVATDRNINGSFDYYPTDTDSTLFDNFENNDTVPMQFQWGDRDASDNLVQGTIISVYIPNAQLNSGSPDDEDGFVKRTAQWQAFETTVTDQEIFIGIL